MEFPFLIVKHKYGHNHIWVLHRYRVEEWWYNVIYLSYEQRSEEISSVVTAQNAEIDVLKICSK